MWKTMDSAPLSDEPVLIATDELEIVIGYWMEWECGGDYGWFLDDGRPITGALAWMPVPRHPLAGLFQEKQSKSEAPVTAKNRDAQLLEMLIGMAEAQRQFVESPSEETLGRIKEMVARKRKVLFEACFPVAAYYGFTFDDALEAMFKGGA